jgi:hypothetical protein
MTVVVVVGATVVGDVVVVTAGATVVVTVGFALESSFPWALTPTAIARVIADMEIRFRSGCFMCLQCLADTAGDWVSVWQTLAGEPPIYYHLITVCQLLDKN